jgi:peptide/nickel transport system substrate-binding protein
VLGAHDLQITLVSANADLPEILAASHFLIVKDGTTDFAAGNGCGPFKLREFKPGVRTVVVRNDNYWREGRPYLDEIELIGIADELSRVNALLSGDVHMINAINPRSTRRVRASPGHRLQVTKSSLYTHLIMQQAQPATGHPDFVLAMKYLFDRDTIQRALFRGYATVANDHPIQPNHPYFLPGLPPAATILNARFHLKRAGCGHPLADVRIAGRRKPRSTCGAMLQQSAAQAGINPAVNRVPADGCRSNHWMKHPLRPATRIPGRRRTSVVQHVFSRATPRNESGWKNERFDQLLVAAGPQATRRNGGSCMVTCRSCCTNKGRRHPAFIDFIDGYDSRIKGLSHAAARGFMGYQFADHVVRGLSRGSARGISLPTHRTSRRRGSTALLLVSVVVFAITSLLPGDAAEQALGQGATPRPSPHCAQFGLDRPAPIRCATRLWGLVTGDPAISMASGLRSRNQYTSARQIRCRWPR